MKIEQETRMYYDPYLDEWFIENQIIVEEIGDFIFKISFGYDEPTMQQVLEEKNRTMQEVYINYMLEGE